MSSFSIFYVADSRRCFFLQHENLLPAEVVTRKYKIANTQDLLRETPANYTRHSILRPNAIRRPKPCLLQV